MFLSVVLQFSLQFQLGIEFVSVVADGAPDIGAVSQENYGKYHGKEKVQRLLLLRELSHDQREGPETEEDYDQSLNEGLSRP